MNQVAKGMLTFGAVATAVTAVTVAGTQRLVDEPRHKRGDPFSDLAKWELGLGITSGIGAGIAGVVALALHHSEDGVPSEVRGVSQLGAVLAGATIGIIAGRLIAETRSPSVKLANS